MWSKMRTWIALAFLVVSSYFIPVASLYYPGRVVLPAGVFVAFYIYGPACMIFTGLIFYVLWKRKGS